MTIDMVITTVSILLITWFSGRHVRKQAMNHLSETGKQKQAQTARWPMLVMSRESYNRKGLMYRRILLVIIVLGVMLAAVTVIFNL